MSVQREYKVYNIINDEELYALLNQIDTSSPIGKRDMAIFQLIITTGMRSTDVVNMKLTDIDWSRGEIHIIQKKTGNPLTLPLLQEAGSAIQDYILNGRPDSDAEEIEETDSQDASAYMTAPELETGRTKLMTCDSLDDLIKNREVLENAFNDMKQDKNFAKKKIRFVLELAFE